MARAKWTADAGDEPAIRCAVSGCDAPAIASLRVDPSAPRAWLVDVIEGEECDEVCTRHAEALADSEGWVVHDARRVDARLPRSIAGVRRAAWIDAPPAEVLRVDLRRRPPAPALDPDELLDADSPLLSRAFAKSRAG